MPIISNYLASEFIGESVDTPLIESHGWHNQGGDNYHYGFKKKAGLWITRMDPSELCHHHPICLFMMVHLDRKKTIQEVETAVHQVLMDGGLYDVEVPFMGCDITQAQEALQKIIAYACSEKPVAPSGPRKRFRSRFPTRNVYRANWRIMVRLELVFHMPKGKRGTIQVGGAI